MKGHDLVFQDLPGRVSATTMAGVSLGMIQVQVPAGVQEGQIVTVVDPNTNQPFSVQVPVGLQPGHVFSCALPTPSLGSSLKERLANAGGKLRLGLPQDAAAGGKHHIRHQLIRH